MEEANIIIMGTPLHTSGSKKMKISGRQEVTTGKISMQKVKVPL